MNIAQRLTHSGAAGAEKSSAQNSRSALLLRLLTWMAVFGFLVGAYFALVYAGTDTTQGNVQRVFYFHVAAFSAASIAFAAAVVGGIVYLKTRNARWDKLALAGVEVGFFLSLITLFTGMVWARPIWNTWWNWDPRLTSDAIMILTYAAYLMLRSGIENPEQRRRFASIYGILAFSTVLITFLIIRIRPDTIHPVVIGPVLTNASTMTAQGDFELNATPGVTAAVAFSSAVWSMLLPLVLVWWRIRLENISERVAMLRVKVLEQ